MFARPSDDQVLALAGLFQAANLVSELAARDRFDGDALLASALSVTRLDADSVVDVYGGVSGVYPGLRIMGKAFGGGLAEGIRPVFQYAVGMHQLGTKLENQPHMTDALQQGLEDIVGRVKLRDIEDDDDQQQLLYEELAALYAKTISTMQPRIMVSGSQGRLENVLTVNRVRSALFAGIRSAFLWHQLGGRRWQLLLHRKSYTARARALTR